MRENEFHTLVVGSGAAGLAAACRLRESGINRVALVTEGLHCGTSFNTGSDKQTYYKLGLSGSTPDSVRMLAESLFAPGSVDGDLAMVEAACSTRAFLKLVELGVPFPRGRYGEFPGYQTDHDTAGRATSCGPYTSKMMCQAWMHEMERLAIPVIEERRVVSILQAGKRAVGVLAWNETTGMLESFRTNNIIFAVGCPGGMYRSSVYPLLQMGGIAPALCAGAIAQSLPEGQFGMASTRFRWNVSGSYMQVLPRVYSTAADGQQDEREFLLDHLSAPDELYSMLFLKGYQWPFDVRKAERGSSRIDQWVYEEIELKRRRVFLDYRTNPTGLDVAQLIPEAREYLARSGATGDTPIERLRQMNPAAIHLYEDHGIHLISEPLEIAVCFQHSNGGLSGNLWWESPTLSHFFPIGEANGSHGIYRPGGSALNAGQVGALRAAEYIAARSDEESVSDDEYYLGLEAEFAKWEKFTAAPEGDWENERREIQERMSKVGAHIRNHQLLESAVPAAWKQFERICKKGGRLQSIINWDLALTQVVYLEAQLYQVESGAGSRGSALVQDGERILPEDEKFRNLILETRYQGEDSVFNHWRPVRPLPDETNCFEVAWSEFATGKIYE